MNKGKTKAKPQQNKNIIGSSLGSNCWKKLKMARIIYSKKTYKEIKIKPHEKLSETNTK